MKTSLSEINQLSAEEQRNLLRSMLEERLASGELYPLSPLQEAIWFLEQLYPGNTAYHLPAAFRLSGQLDVLALQRSLETIIARHASLRTLFVVVDGVPRQKVFASGKLAMDIADFPHFSSDGGSYGEVELIREAQKLAFEFAVQPFNLEEGPLMRVRLLRVACDSFFLFFCMHHLISDGWSIAILIKELVASYEEITNGRSAGLPELQFQYSDYSLWHEAALQSQHGGQLTKYWQKRLSGDFASEWPADFARPVVQKFSGARVLGTISRQEFVALNKLAAEDGCTLFMVLLTAFHVIQSRYTQHPAVLTGTPISHRSLAGSENLIGMFTNVVPLKTQIQGSPLFRELLRDVRNATLNDFQHWDLPLDRIVNALGFPRDTSRSPLVQCLLALQNAPRETFALGDVRIERLATEPIGVQFDVAVYLWERDECLDVNLEYNVDLFSAAKMDRLLGHYLKFLREVAHCPDRSLSAIEFLTPADKDHILACSRGPGSPLDQDETLLSPFVAMAKEHSRRIAVVSEGGTLTYGDLDSLSSRLANYLQRKGAGPDKIVAVCLARSPNLVVALCAIIRAGAAYLPLDPSYPRERLDYVIGDAQVDLIVTDENLSEVFGPAGRGRCICLDTPNAPWLTEEAMPSPLPEPEGDNAAYVIYTSGSTGKPKGVITTHRGIVNRLRWMQKRFQLGPQDRVLQKTPYTFDVSVWEFFWPLREGVSLALAKPGGHQDSSYLSAFLQKNAVTTVHFVPSMLAAFLDEPGVRECRSLVRVLCSGEPLPAELKNRFFQVLSAELHNLYGPTEASVDVTAWQCEPQAIRVPIGWPIDNMNTYVLDQFLQPLPPGVPGRLFLAGPGLARGYANAPQLTADRFLPDPYAKAWGERMYDTGDLAQFGENGALEFVGRRDFQVKIRGFRIELGEIESALLGHPDVREAVVVVRVLAGSTRLIAYLVLQSGASLKIDDLRRFLQARLPEYMVPASWMQMEDIPRTASGKINRKALPQPGSERPELDGSFVAPRTATEITLAGVWKKILGLDRVGVEDNFFSLGGDSLLSIRIVTAAAQEGLNFGLQQFFQNQTIASLAATLDRPLGTQWTDAMRPTAPFELISASDRQAMPPSVVDAYPLSLLQAGMFFHSRFDLESDLYHNVTTCHFQGPWNPAKFDQALQEMAVQPAVLRTGFDLHRYSVPLQLVYDACRIPLEVADLSALPESTQRAKLDGCFAGEREKKFDFTKPPLLRFFLHRRSQDSFQVTWTEHHAVLDGWSVAAMLVEVIERYAALCAGRGSVHFEQPAAAYRDAIALELKAIHSEVDRNYWLNMVGDCEVTRLSRLEGGVRRAENRRVEYSEIPVSEELSHKLKDFARKAGVPIKTVLLAAHVKAVSVLGGATDVLTGLVTNGRPEFGGGDRLFGLFLNTMPFRVSVAGGSWKQLIQRLFDLEREIMPHRWFPLPELQRLADRGPLFESTFNFTHFHVYQQLGRIENFKLLSWDSFQETNLSLITNFSLDPATAEVRLRFDYDPEVFSRKQVENIGAIFVRTMQTMVHGPDVPHSSDYYLSLQERQWLTENVQGRREDFGHGKLLHEEFRQQAKRRGKAVAVIDEEGTLSYEELDRQSERMALYLQNQGVSPETRVGVCLGRSRKLVLGLLGVVKAGAAYVPLDPVNPRERLEYVIRDADIRVVLTERKLEGLLPDAVGRVCLDAGDTWEISNGTTLKCETDPDHALYVIYTSGSTGQPKGVVVSHRNVWRLLASTREMYTFSEQDVWTLFHSYGFDFSVWELWGALLYGGRLVVPAHWVTRSGEEFYKLLLQHGVTVLNQTPSAFRELMRVDEERGEPGAGLKLKWVIFGGEALETEKLRGWMERYGNINPRLVNMYGITETTVHVTCRELRREDSQNKRVRSPIGKPLPDLRVYVLDEDMNLSPNAVAGEMYVGGAGVARGYLKRPDLTAERFVPDAYSGATGARLYRSGDLARWLESGEMEFLGRRDQQVKIRGFRVELGEIEATLMRHPGMQQCVAVMRQSETPTLVAYCIAKPGFEIDFAEVRDFAESGLPDYMVPNAFVALECLPLTANGKLDRRALPAPSSERQQLSHTYAPPETETETAISQMWARVLGLDKVGLTDDFFELGGHSVLATRLVSEINAHFGIDLSVRVVFESSTLRGMVSEVEKLVAVVKPEVQTTIRRATRERRTIAARGNQQG